MRIDDVNIVKLEALEATEGTLDDVLARETRLVVADTPVVLGNTVLSVAFTSTEKDLGRNYNFFTLYI